MITSAIPVIAISESDRSADYYCRVLGFQKMFAYRPDPSRRDPCYLGVARDGVWLHLQSFKPERAGMTDAFLWVADVDLLHAEISAQGVVVQLPPTDQTWGTRETGIRDPDGNVLVFATQAWIARESTLSSPDSEALFAGRRFSYARGMFAVVSEQTTITSDSGRVLIGRRRMRFLQSMLAVLAAILALPVFGVLAVAIVVWVDSRPGIRAVTGGLSVAMALLVVGGIVGTYLLLNPRWHVEFLETTDSEPILHLAHHSGHWPFRVRYTLTTATGDFLGRLEQTWSLFQRTWNLVDNQGHIVGQAKERVSHVSDLLQFLIRRKRRLLTPRPPVTFDVLRSLATPSGSETIGEYEGRANIDGTLLIANLPPDVDPRLLVAFGMVALLTQSARGS